MTILLVATGGTIASRPGPDGAVATALTGAEVLASIGDVDVDDVAVIDIAAVPSWNVEPVLRSETARLCVGALEDGRASGVIVTHGTDTVEETAWLTELLAGPATAKGPIVFTAAMRHSAALAADGPANLRDSLLVVRDPVASGRGVLVCVNGEIHHARWVTKTDAHALHAFQSPATGPVGRVVNGAVSFTIASPPGPPPAADDRRIEPEVSIVGSYAGIDGGIVDFFLDRGARGIVVEGTGAGNVNQALVPGIGRAIAGGVAVVLTTRCATGAVVPIYGGDGGGARLAELGVIGGGDLSAIKAQLALMVALGRDPRPDAVRVWFADLVGGDGRLP